MESFFEVKTQKAMFELLSDVKHYVGSVSLIIAIKEDLPSFLSSESKSLDDICESCHWSKVTARLVCDALVAMDWLQVDDKERYRVSPRMELLLPNLSKLAPMVEDWALGLKDLSELEGLMSKDQWADGAVAQKYAYTHKGVDEFEAENYTVAMFQSVEPMALALVEKVDFSEFNSVLDVGGGFGKLAETVQRKIPSISWVGIFDLPSAEAGFRKLQESGGYRQH